jgi:TPR repeat protein
MKMLSIPQFALALATLLATCPSAGGQSQPPWTPLYKASNELILCLPEGERAELAARARFGDIEAQDKLGTQHVSECAGKNDPAWGLELLTKAALQENAHAQFRLARIYQEGGPVRQDMRTAIAWFEKSAALGNAPAQNDLGVILLQGNAVARDLTRAAVLFQTAATQGLRPAVYNLAVVLDLGQGIPQDYSAARHWYQWAGEHGDADAEYRLALLLEQGLGGNKDEAQARNWLLNAAEDGSNAAQVKLGVRSPADADVVSSGYFHYQIAQKLFEGKTLPRDPDRALKFVEKSAEAGYPPAFLALGRMYARGDGVAKNEAKAVGYLQTAYNALAWTLVTAEDLKVQDPLKALSYAVKAVELTGKKDAYALDTLAHVYLTLGNVDRALEMESEASALQPENDIYHKTLAELRTIQQNAGR